MKGVVRQACTALCAVAAWGASAEPQQLPLGSGAELVAACRQASDAAPEQSGLCDGFLLGYLQARPEVVFSEELPSGYMQRVLRTRVPVHPETSSIKTPTYCLEGADSIEAIRTGVAGLDPATVEAVAAGSVVEGLLEAHFRCRS